MSDKQTMTSTVSPDSQLPARQLNEFNQKGFFQCCVGSCLFNTVTSEEFQHHLVNCHNGNNIFVCVHCGHIVFTCQEFLAHLHEHYAEIKISCNYPDCDFTTRETDELFRHIHLAHHEDENHVCFKCNKQFDCVLDLIIHMQTDSLSLVKCPHCPAKDLVKGRILEHIRSSHPSQGRLVSISRCMLCKERRMNEWPTVSRYRVQAAMLSLQHQKLTENEHCASSISAVNRFVKREHVSDCETVSEQQFSGTRHVDTVSVKVENVNADIPSLASNDVQIAKSDQTCYRGIDSVCILPNSVCSVGYAKFATLPTNDSLPDRTSGDNGISNNGRNISLQPNIPEDNTRRDYENSEEHSSSLGYMELHGTGDSDISDDNSLPNSIDLSADIPATPTVGSSSRECHDMPQLEKYSPSAKPFSIRLHSSDSIPDTCQVPDKYVTNSNLHQESSATDIDRDLCVNTTVDAGKSVSARKERCVVPTVSMQVDNDINVCSEELNNKIDTNMETEPMDVCNSKKSDMSCLDGIRIILPRGDKPKSQLHLYQKLLVCKRCSYYITSNESMYGHLRTVHNFTKQLFECSECKDILTEDDVVDHHEESHPDTDESYLPITLSKAYDDVFMLKTFYRNKCRNKVFTLSDIYKLSEEMSNDKGTAIFKDNQAIGNDISVNITVEDNDENTNKSSSRTSLDTVHQEVKHDRKLYEQTAEHQVLPNAKPNKKRKKVRRLTMSKTKKRKLEKDRTNSDTVHQEVKHDLKLSEQTSERQQLPNVKPTKKRKKARRLTMSKQKKIQLEKESPVEDVSVGNDLVTKTSPLKVKAVIEGMKKESNTKNKGILKKEKTVKDEKNFEVEKGKTKQKSKIVKEEKNIKQENIKKKKSSSPAAKTMNRKKDSPSFTNLTADEFNDPLYEFRCRYCTCRTTSFESFLQHVTYHIHFKPYQCGYCSFTGFSHSRVEQHITEEHKKKKKLVGFVINPKSLSRCEEHVRNAYVSKDIEDFDLKRRLEKNRLKKLLQKTSTSSKNTKKGHLKSSLEKSKSKSKKVKAAVAVEQKIKTEDDVSLAKTKERKSLYLCPYCKTKRGMVTWKSLKTEIFWHIHYKPYACKYCDFPASASVTRIRDHVINSHPGEKVEFFENFDPAKELRAKILFKKSVELTKLHKLSLKKQTDRKLSLKKSKIQNAKSPKVKLVNRKKPKVKAKTGPKKVLSALPKPSGPKIEQKEENVLSDIEKDTCDPNPVCDETEMKRSDDMSENSEHHEHSDGNSVSIDSTQSNTVTVTKSPDLADVPCIAQPIEISHNYDTNSTEHFEDKDVNHVSHDHTPNDTPMDDTHSPEHIEDKGKPVSRDHKQNDTPMVDRNSPVHLQDKDRYHMSNDDTPSDTPMYDTHSPEHFEDKDVNHVSYNHTSDPPMDDTHSPEHLEDKDVNHVSYNHNHTSDPPMDDTHSPEHLEDKDVNHVSYDHTPSDTPMDDTHSPEHFEDKDVNHVSYNHTSDPPMDDTHSQEHLEDKDLNHVSYDDTPSDTPMDDTNRAEHLQDKDVMFFHHDHTPSDTETNTKAPDHADFACIAYTQDISAMDDEI